MKCKEYEGHKYKEIVDIVFDMRYVVRGYWNTHAFPKWRARNEFEYDRFLYYHDNFCKTNNIVQELGMDWFALSSLTMGLPFSANDLNIRVETFKIPYKEKEYITFHAGLGAERGYTKSYPPENWDKLISLLVKDFVLVQVGGEEDKNLKIQNDKVLDLRGKTNLFQVAKVIKEAKFHIDCEGGLVHIAKAVRTKSIVMFGATPIKFFGYQDNINIRAGSCQNCWWVHDKWFISCPRKREMVMAGKTTENTFFSPCMLAISPEIVYLQALQLAEKE